MRSRKGKCRRTDWRTPTRSPDFGPRDEAGATEALVGGLEPDPGEHTAWDGAAIHLDAANVPEAKRSPGDDDLSISAGAILLPPELDDREKEPEP
jgi:hypothetical protein